MMLQSHTSNEVLWHKRTSVCKLHSLIKQVFPESTPRVPVGLTLVPHRVGEFGQVWKQLSLQAERSQAKAPEQGLGSHTVLPVLPGTTAELAHHHWSLCAVWNDLHPLKNTLLLYRSNDPNKKHHYDAPNFTGD